MRLILALVCLLFNLVGYSQLNPILTFDEYIEIVKENHPMTYQAALLSDMAISTKRIARGGFDPKIEGDWNHKSFDDKNYYSLANGAIKVPTWYGIDLKAGYDRNSGEFLSNSDFLPERGLWNAGISIPLGKGLVIDNRRAELKRADIYRNVTDQERLLMVNELMYKASIAYLEWQTSRAFLEIAREGQNLAQVRFDGTRGRFINGDVPAIDTLESLISLQTRELDLSKAQQDLDNAVIALNNFLWIDGEVPLELDSLTAPEAIDTELLDYQVDSLTIIQDLWLAAHPELMLYAYKIDNLNLDQKLAREELKPDLRINYNPLIAVADDALFDEFNTENYKIGASFSYPILQRKERGKIDLNKLKIRDTEYERGMKNQELTVKLNTYINNINQTFEQYELLDTTVTNYNRMLIAENRKFDVGESSIFLVNSRENKYLESRYKLVQASRKLIINRFTYLLYAVRLQEVL
ncbi:MAG: TolC family protein [Saprospiraceae bacterium]|nr:TolC family protein [Saprospiraceae bacterium]